MTTEWEIYKKNKGFSLNETRKENNKEFYEKCMYAMTSYDIFGLDCISVLFNKIQ